MKKHTAVIRELLTLAGRRALDVGCGDGGLTRFLTRQGAQVVGLECGEAQMVRARAAERAGDERYLFGRAEALPFSAAGFDLVVLFHVLHHVPAAAQSLALAEARRVLRQDGLLYIQEPLAEGPYFEMIRPIEDETALRAVAYEKIQQACSEGLFGAEAEVSYAAPVKHKDFESFKAGLIAVDPRRAATVAANEASLEAAFTAAAEQREDGFWFHVPARANLLRKIP